ncbi:MAG: PorT family protein [Bacteroidales bacterium]|nr:PorT family protein [Bacteroidales bacterium]
MKKNITIIAYMALICAVQVQAQMSVNAGYSSARIKANGQRVYWQSGVFGGLSYNVALGGKFGIAPGAYVNIAENSGTSNDGYTFTYTKYREISANIPLHLTFRIDLAEGASLYAFAGPELNCGISAQNSGYTASTFAKPTGGHQTHTYDYYNAASVGADDQLRRVNVSGMAGIGVRNRYSNFMLGVERTLMNCRASDAVNESYLRLFLGAGIMF